MKKQLFFLAVAALALASCSSENDVVQTPNVQQTTVDEIAVNFDAYQSRGTTRAGWAGELTTAKLKGDADGFGVFGYYTNGEVYGETAKPDFMYNQHVTYTDSEGAWVYSPLKYWPNEFGTTAASEEVDRLTFFAYAPYVEVSPSTGVVTSKQNSTGIIGMSRNTATGNPLVKYYADLTPANSVDLCWGVAKETVTSSVDGNSNTITQGKPFIDVMKPKVGDKISFDFKHALSQLNVQIDTDVDALSHSSSELDGNTRIYVRSVTFEGFATKGSLDLNSDYSISPSQTTPNWYDLAGTGKLSTDAITIYDGRRDGKEGVENATAKNETPSDLNPAIVQSKAYTTTLPTGEIQYTSFSSDPNDPGVTNTAVNLFNSTDADAPILVIPTTEDMKITIVYDVETADATLSGYLSDGKTRGSTIENSIIQDIKLIGGDAMTLESGKKYVVKLHLGLTSVKFEASVTDWEDANESDVDLPYNAMIPWNGSTAGSMSTEVSAVGNTHTMVISGLEGKDIASFYKSGDFITDISKNKVGDKLHITYTTSTNDTWSKKTGHLYVQVGTNTLDITVTQAPKTFSLSLAKGTNSIVPSADGVTSWAGFSATVKRTRSGETVELEPTSSTSPGAGYFFFGTNAIVLGDTPATGDIYVVKIAKDDVVDEATLNW